MRRPLLVCLALTALLVSGCSAATPLVTPSARQVSPAEFAIEMDRGERFVVNVHTPDEGAIAGTDAAIPFGRLEERAAELPEDRAMPLAVYCMTGRMSATAVETLSGLGYTDIVELAGGMVAWEADGRPLVPPGD